MGIAVCLHLSSLLTLGNTCWNNVSFRAGWNTPCSLSREPDVETETCFVRDFGQGFQQRPPTFDELRWTPQQSLGSERWGAFNPFFGGSVSLCIETKESLDNSAKWLARVSLNHWLGHSPPVAGVIRYAREKVLTQASFTLWRRDGDLGLP